MNWLSAPFRDIWQHRGLLWRTALVELKGLYAGSLLGLFWVLLGPMLLLGLYAFIYVVVFRFRPTTMTQLDYVLYICAGLVPFLGFAASLSTGAGSLSTNKAVLVNTVFPAELVPFRTIVVQATITVSGLLIVAVADAALGGFSAWVLLLPLVLVLQVMFVAGVVWLLALANLVLRDIQQALTFVILGLFVITPIAYVPAMIPATLAPVIYVNPLAYFVIWFQAIVVLDTPPPTHVMVGAVFISIASFCFGFAVFQRAKQFFFDYA